MFEFVSEKENSEGKNCKMKFIECELFFCPDLTQE